MKNIKYFLLLSVTLIVGACDLEEDPKGIVTPVQFFQSEEEVKQFIQGAYAPLRNYDFYGMMWWRSAEGVNDQVTMRPDLLPGITFSSPDLAGWPLFWKWSYTAIASANMLINELNNSPLTDELKKAYLAEAHFLRGFVYQHLITGYGKVPLILDNTPESEALTMGRTDTDVIWEQIKKDMIYAYENGVDNHGNIKSRGTKWSALALLSRFYLYHHEYANAANAAKTVMESGKYSLMPDFGDVFLEKNETGVEAVFTIEFLKNVGTSSHASFFTPRADYESSSTPGFFWNGWSSFMVASGLPGMFEEGDIRKEYTLCNVNILDNNKPFKRAEWYFGPKFWDFNNPRAASAIDFKVMRYAEVLLNFAEAENEANGPTDAAYDAINQVRARAKLPALEGLTKEQFREKVRHERGVELVGEGQRKWDLVRWGIWLETMKSLPASDLPTLGAQNVSERDILFSIPAVEIAKNPNLLPNNPGY